MVAPEIMKARSLFRRSGNFSYERVASQGFGESQAPSCCCGSLLILILDALRLTPRAGNCTGQEASRRKLLFFNNIMSSQDRPLYPPTYPSIDRHWFDSPATDGLYCANLITPAPCGTGTVPFQIRTLILKAWIRTVIFKILVTNS